MDDEEFQKLKDAFYDRKLLECGDPGRIAEELSDLQGYAVWIPRFVRWLYDNYYVIRNDHR